MYHHTIIARLARRLILATGVLLVFTNPATAGPITITVHPALAPNQFGSLSFSGWANNSAISGLQQNGASVGSAGLPTFYQPVSEIHASQMVATNFPSWQGKANPSGAFANELGNRLHFGVHIDGNGTEFSLSQLFVEMSSSDPENLLGFPQDSFKNDAYDDSRIVGIDKDGNSIVGSAEQKVVELWYYGVGNAFEVLDSDPGGTDQEKINLALSDILAFLGSSFSVTATYTIVQDGQTSSGTGVVSVIVAQAIPEPSGVLLWAGLFGGTLVVRRLRRRDAKCSGVACHVAPTDSGRFSIGHTAPQ